MIDAIIRTLFRLYISHRKLLEWITAEEAGRQLNNSFLGVFKKMLVGEALILVAGTASWIVYGNIS
jgi:cyclic beta-1,2-glucan synthetase